MSQILIVGAGPVGLTLAAELSRYGVPVRLIDRSPEPTRTSKALAVWSRTLELMDRMGCTAAFLDAGLKVRGATFHEGAKTLGHVRFDGIDSPYPFGLMIPQSETERLLTAHLGDFGIAVERRAELVDFAEASDGVVARLRHGDGREESLRTPWLIGCDGAHSTVRHRLGLEFRGHPENDDWALADVRLDGDGCPPRDAMSIYFHRDGPCVVFPIPGGRARIIGTRGRADPDHRPAEPTIDDVQALIDRRTGGGFRAFDPVWLSNFRINERKVADYRKGRVFLAGDAAHVHSPAGGQGMNTGMQDAIGLAWRLALVERGEAAPSVLDSFSTERSGVGETVLRDAERLTRMGTLSNPLAQAARDVAVRVLLGFQSARDAMATQMSETAIGYPDSPMSDGPGAGARFSPRNYAGPAPGAGPAPRFVVYAADGTESRELASRFPCLVEPQVRRPPDEHGLWIVRPDGHVGYGGDARSWTAAEDYLRRWSGEPASSSADGTGLRPTSSAARVPAAVLHPADLR